MRARRLGSSGSTWVPLGPAPLASDASGIGQQDYGWVSGRATSVAIDPADPTASTVYLGGAYGGVWKSSNATADPASVVWSPLTDDQATLAIGAIAIQPQLSNPNPANSLILAGTGEANSSSDSYYGLGILRSIDAGNTWKLISADSTGTRSFDGMAFSKIAFSTANPNLAVAATASASEGILEGLADPLTANLGLYYSQDDGNSWTFANVQDGNTTTAPGSASSVIYDGTAGLFFAALRYHGFYSSSDGINWARLGTQPGAGLTVSNCPAQSSSQSCPIYRGEIAVVPGRNETYVWYVDVNDNDQGIWETTNAGATWTRINEFGILSCGDDAGCGTDDGAYNLELAAVPDGDATDLYAGAINLYKCQITSAVPDCSDTGANTFLNLTHAYGCSSIAKVHPAQHSVSFLLLNNSTQDVMYFANDGGLYRALDGYTGLTTGSCGGTNQFDSLNQTLGSLTQFVSFSEPQADGNTFVGGAQGNGSPATQSALTSTRWWNVNAGDGGYTQIDPANPDDWFVSSPPDAASGVNIFRCESGINCHTEDFQNDQVVSGTNLGGDTGPFYPPFILDPQNSSELIVGTCRLWRGSSDGSGFASLTNNFENGGAGICTGSETNLVRSIAAGGPMDNNGFSNVIYAGTDGFGPLIPTVPPGGHVWVSTNVAGGSTTWNDQTGEINPNNFPISSIAIDNSDATGQTAYVTIMGFHVSHVWKTTNAGASWTDFSGSLPDAPADAVLVDSSTNPSMIYVGADVGVFSTPSVAANWTEVGPAPNSGLSGYLPNAAVTALAMFNDGTDKWLRASTYGRGIWQFPLITSPDFAISISNTPLTVLVGSQGTFDGSVFALDGYSYPVNLRCQPGTTSPPSTCTVDPATVTPSGSGTPFTITTAASTGTYAFQLQGIGTDSQAITHEAPVTLNVVVPDYSIVITNSPLSAYENTTTEFNGTLTSANGYNSPVNLSCGAGAPPTCSVAPAQVTPTTNGAAFTVTVGSNQCGQYNFNIIGTDPRSVPHSYPVQFTSNSLAQPDYTLEITNPSLTAAMNTSAKFNATLTSTTCYASLVNLSCGSGAPPTCTASPSSVQPSINGAPFTVTVSSNQAQDYSFSIVGQGADASHIQHSLPVSFDSTASAGFTLSLTNNSGQESIASGETAVYQLELSSSTGTFPSVVSLTYAGCPPMSTCSLSQTSVAAGAKGTINLTYTIHTASATIAKAVRWNGHSLYVIWIWLPGLILAGHCKKNRKRAVLLLLLATALLMLSFLSSCGGLQGNSPATTNPGTPAGTYNMTVTASMYSAPGAPAKTADLVLNVN